MAQIIKYKLIFELNKVKLRFISLESVESKNLNSCVDIKIKNIILKILKERPEPSIKLEENQYGRVEIP